MTNVKLVYQCHQLSKQKREKERRKWEKRSLREGET